MPFPSNIESDFNAGYILRDENHEWPQEVADHYRNTYTYPDWYYRESARLDGNDPNGKNYTRLPGEWLRLPQVYGHYAHYSVKNPGLIAFTESYDKGVRDIQNVMKPGRYLAKYYGPESRHPLSAPEVARLANVISSLAKGFEVNFARTREEIRDVYMTGPRSCMAHHMSDYATNGIHPAEAYATPDLGIAYVKSDDKRIVARTIVRFHDDKPVSHGRVYGDSYRLESGLNAIGVRYNGDCLDGARMLRIEVRPGVYVAPYLDHVGAVDIESDYLWIRRNGDYGCQNTNGIIGSPRYVCHCCDDSFEDVTEIDGEYYCDDCRDSEFTYSSFRNEYVCREDVIEAYYENWSGRRVSCIITQENVDSGSFHYTEPNGLYLESALCVRVIHEGGTLDSAEYYDPRHVPDDYIQCRDSRIYCHPTLVVYSKGGTPYHIESGSGARIVRLTESANHANVAAE